jgi:hypothetical protein
LAQPNKLAHTQLWNTLGLAVHATGFYHRAEHTMARAMAQEYCHSVQT